MIHEDTSATALERFWAHVGICGSCSPQGACAECKSLLEAVTTEVKASASLAPSFNAADAISASNVKAAEKLSTATDAELMQEYEEICQVSCNSDARREMIFAEIDRRMLSMIRS
jgi:hypothetical protein